MTTNQTIDGVPRELKLCPRCANNGRSDDCPECQGSVAWYSKPPNEAFTEWYSRNPYENLTNSTAAWMAFKAGRDHASLWSQKLTTQSQGEPVAWMYRRKGGECLGQLVQMESDNLKDVREGKVVEGRRILWPRDDYTDWKPLYAEQPAPVAVTGNRTPFEIEHDAEPGDEAAFRQWRQERLNTKPTCCGSCPGGCVYGLKA